MMTDIQKEADLIEARLMKCPKEAIVKAVAPYAAASFAGDAIIKSAERLSFVVQLKAIERELGRLAARMDALEGKSTKKALSERVRIARKVRQLTKRRWRCLGRLRLMTRQRSDDER
jgi:hypothetical protein